MQRPPITPLEPDDIEALAAIAANPRHTLSVWRGDRLWFHGLAYWDKENGNTAVLTARGKRLLAKSPQTQRVQSGMEGK